MRKLMVSVLSLVLLLGVIVPTVSAQHNYGRTYPTYPSYGSSYPNYRRNNTLKKVGIGTVAGAVIGGLIGGKKGAIIGGIAGAGGGYVWSRNSGRYNRPYYNWRQPYYGNQRQYYNNYPARRHY